MVVDGFQFMSDSACTGDAWMTGRLGIRPECSKADYKSKGPRAALGRWSVSSDWPQRVDSGHSGPAAFDPLRTFDLRTQTNKFRCEVTEHASTIPALDFWHLL